MDSSTKEVTIDAVRCEEVQFHAESNGDEKNILMSFNELVTNLSSNSNQFASRQESIKAIIKGHENSYKEHSSSESTTNFNLLPPFSHQFTKGKELRSEHFVNDYEKSSKEQNCSQDKISNTSAPPFPYRFVRSKEPDRIKPINKHKDSRKEPSSSHTKMNISFAPHSKLSHQHAKRQELERAMVFKKYNDNMGVQRGISSQKQGHSTDSLKSVESDMASAAVTSSNENNLKEKSSTSTRDVVMKMALDSLTDTPQFVTSKVNKKTRLNDDKTSLGDHSRASSQPAKENVTSVANNDVSNKCVSQRKTSSKEGEKNDNIKDRNVNVVTSSESKKCGEENSSDQPQNYYESFRFEPLPSFCDKSFGKNLKPQPESPSNEKLFKCHCNKTFAKERYLKMHQKVHSEERPYKCTICNKTFRWRSNLTEHQHIHDEKPFQCGVCKKEFTQLSDFRNHQLIHSEERPVKCQCCDKSFDDPRYLKIHYQIHSEDRPYKCNICDKAFRWRSNLTGHMQIHSFHKPYRCEICMQGFTQISNYKNHQVLHSGEKPFKCPDCDKTFAQARYMKTHQKLHSEERPYKCKHCGKAFRWPGNLRGHLQLHGKDKAYKCEHCGSSFTQYASLSRHLNHHCTKRCAVPSQTFLDHLELLIQQRQQSKEQQGFDEASKGKDKGCTETSMLLSHLSRGNCKEIHVVFKQQDCLQPKTIEDKEEVKDQDSNQRFVQGISEESVNI